MNALFEIDRPALVFLIVGNIDVNTARTDIRIDFRSRLFVYRNLD
jgi:hypothetical protein